MRTLTDVGLVARTIGLQVPVTGHRRSGRLVGYLELTAIKSTYPDHSARSLDREAQARPDLSRGRKHLRIGQDC